MPSSLAGMPEKGVISGRADKMAAAGSHKMT